MRTKLLSRRGSSSELVASSDLSARRKSLVWNIAKPLHDNIDVLALSIVRRFEAHDQASLPAIVRRMPTEYKAVLDPTWQDVFSSEADLNQALTDAFYCIRIGIQSGVRFNGLRALLIRSIRLDTTRSCFVIEFDWQREPSWWQRLKRRHH